MTEKNFIVVRCERAISTDVAERLRDTLRDSLGSNIPIVVVGDGMRIEVHKFNPPE